MKLLKFDPHLDQHKALQDRVQRIGSDADESGQEGTIHAWVVVVEREDEMHQRWIETYRPAGVYMREIVALLEDSKFSTLAKLNEAINVTRFETIDDDEDPA